MTPAPRKRPLIALPDHKWLHSRRFCRRRRREIITQRANHQAKLFRHPAREKKKLPNAKRPVCFGNRYPGGLRSYDDAESCEMIDSNACSQHAATLDFVLGLSRQTIPQEGRYARLDQNSCAFSVHLNCGGHVEVMTLGYTRPALIMWSDGQHQRALEHPTRRAALATLEWEYDRVQEIGALDPPDEHDQGGSSITSPDLSHYKFLQPVEGIDDVNMTDPPSRSLSGPPSGKKRSIDDDDVPDTPLRKRRSLSGSVSGSPSGRRRSIDDQDGVLPGTPPRKRRSPPDFFSDLLREKEGL
ncbi:hypothetical protein DL767_004638 [Monosporascus sp. MG133]|nr:hypothetical protein DL767_004638 [Monosporascus sp. MG133]